MRKREYQICINCVMDTSDSAISFNSEGVCDQCTYYYDKIKTTWDTGVSGRKTLQKIIDKIKLEGKGKEFDCIMGMSGGADSSYMLHLIVKEFGLRPLVFHVDGGWNSELAVRNIEVMVDKLGLDLYTEVINWEEMRDFQLAYFKASVPHLDVPQDHAFIASLYKFANKYNIKYILNGGNYSTECIINPKEWTYYGTDMFQNNDIHTKFGSIPLKAYPKSSILNHKIYLKYFKGIKVIRPLNYLPYIKEDAMKYLQKNYDWTPYAQKHFESRFTRFYEGYWMPKKFGYDTRRVQFSSLIVTGQMRREDAILKLLEPAIDDETAKHDFDYVATKLGITNEQLTDLMNLPNKTYRDYKNQEWLFNIGVRFLNFIGLEKYYRR